MKIDKNTNSIKHVMSSKNYGVSVEEQKVIVNNLPAGIKVSAHGLNGVLVDSKVSDGGSVYLNTKGGNVVLSIGQDSKVVHIK